MAITQQTVRQFISGIALIIIFISLMHTFLKDLIAKYPYAFLVGAVFIFVFDRQLAEKFKKG